MKRPNIVATKSPSRESSNYYVHKRFAHRREDSSTKTHTCREGRYTVPTGWLPVGALDTIVPCASAEQQLLQSTSTANCFIYGSRIGFHTFNMRVLAGTQRETSPIQSAVPCFQLRRKKWSASLALPAPSAIVREPRANSAYLLVPSIDGAKARISQHFLSAHRACIQNEPSSRGLRRASVARGIVDIHAAEVGGCRGRR